MSNTTYLSPGVRELLFGVSPTINYEENDQDQLSIDEIRQCLIVRGIIDYLKLNRYRFSFL